MGVAAWGYGTGATGTGSHPFSLTIQGIDVIDSVPMDTVSVTTSLASNAMLEFMIEDRLSAIAIPGGFADVLFTDHTNAEIIFSGLVIGVEVTALAVGRMLGVRCVDYGYLLDSRTFHPAVTWGGATTFDVDPIVLRYCALGLAGPITAGAPSPSTGSPSGDSRVSLPGWILGVGQTTQSGTLRGALDNLAGNFYDITLIPDYLTAGSDLAVFVDPERRLNVWPLTGNAGAAPATIVETTPGVGEANAENLTVTKDYTAVRTHIWIEDSDPTGTDYSSLVSGSVIDSNGYELEAGAASPDLSSWESALASGWVRLGPADDVRIRGSFSIIGTKNWRIGQVVSISAPSVGLGE